MIHIYTPPQLSTISTILRFTWQALDQLPAPPRPSASAPLRPSLTLCARVDQLLTLKLIFKKESF